jgi:hypothetical protein
MKSAEIQVGSVYLARVGGRVVPLRVTGTFEYSVYAPRRGFSGLRDTTTRTGWTCTNTTTGREIRVRSSQRFRGAVTPADQVKAISGTTVPSGAELAKKLREGV